MSDLFKDMDFVHKPLPQSGPLYGRIHIAFPQSPRTLCGYDREDWIEVNGDMGYTVPVLIKKANCCKRCKRIVQYFNAGKRK